LADAGLLQLDAKGKPNGREYLPGIGRVRCYRPVPDFFQKADGPDEDERGGADAAF